MIRVEQDPTVPPGKAEALDADGKVLATITLPHEMAPSGTATIRLGGDVFSHLIEVLDELGHG